MKTIDNSLNAKNIGYLMCELKVEKSGGRVNFIDFFKSLVLYGYKLELPLEKYLCNLEEIREITSDLEKARE